MRDRSQEVVVITGASAGIGRAAVREFAHHRAKIALIAREPERLEAARAEAERLGSPQAIAIVADTADHAQVEAAAERAEAELGPIDIWVNNAMVTMFAPFADISPEDYRRVTDVTYHGFVWGTMAALKRMRPRGRGTILQVGSALAYRSIPLQSPYCGAKHAIKGFTQSLRTELEHEHSKVHLVIVDMPGVNTPQFEWCKTTLTHHPKPTGTCYQPEVAGQQSLDPIPADRPDNLWTPVPGPFAAHGSFDRGAWTVSPEFWAAKHRGWLWAGAALGLGVLGLRRRHARHQTRRT